MKGFLDHWVTRRDEGWKGHRRIAVLGRSPWDAKRLDVTRARAGLGEIRALVWNARLSTITARADHDGDSLRDAEGSHVIITHLDFERKSLASVKRKVRVKPFEAETDGGVWKECSHFIHIVQGGS
jgi:hypothetical protein